MLTNCDCLENFLPPVLRPLQWLAHVPGAYQLIAAGGQSARMRRSALGYGMLTHRPIADELTGSWARPDPQAGDMRGHDSDPEGD